ncbi:MAG: C40 family peptidase, partial [Polyangiaceae bacterium]|nr:C40 family peptidase [Polyangiaceae bacterium]
LGYLQERVQKGELVDAGGAALAASRVAALAPVATLPPLAPELRVALGPTPLRCGPDPQPFYKGPAVDLRFDRNLCTTLRPQEPVLVLGRWPNGMWLARTSYALGWLAGDAALSPVVPPELAAPFARGTRLRLRGEHTVAGPALGLAPAAGTSPALEATLPDRTLVPLGAGEALGPLFATLQGFAAGAALPADAAVSTVRPLTRRALYTEAFGYLDTPYGWGGAAGGHDCSSFLREVFETFGLHLPRNSGAQAQYGTYTVELGGGASVEEKLARADVAARHGIALLHFPGHIMLYLGRNAAGAPRVVHAFAEYLEACPGGGDTLKQVDRVQVSDLTLGAGTARGSLGERITHLTAFAAATPAELAPSARRRPPAPLDVPVEQDCEEREGVSVFVSPAQPSAGEPVRIVVTSSDDLGSVEIALRAPDGRRVAPEVHRQLGPPWSYWVEAEAPAKGAWIAAIGEGTAVAGCKRFKVAASGAKRRAGDGAVWRPRARWSGATEELYAAFVQQLFDYGADDARTWPNLQALLGARDKNLLHDHLGQREDERLVLEPDCADLPFFLRAYFAWKLRLPFGFHRCNRGADGRAPRCDDELVSSLEERDERDEVAAFAAFLRRTVADGVHSGTGRTPPGADASDLYPVPLARESVRPGAVFADPYGHVLMVAGWVPQGAATPGVLVGAESQPDGTIGRRRFWQGSFLFTPDTASAGAGFKAFRPLVHRGERVRSVDDDAIGAPFAPYSEEQYGLSAEAFYDRVQVLANPLPVAPERALGALVDALAEQAERRVLSVHAVEAHFASGGGVVDMPKGSAIFETKGAWEDFATPSRDMRLLIAVDTLLDFPASIARAPARFGIAADAAAAAAASMRRALDAALAGRRFAYQRSDGSRFELALGDLVARQKALEVGYDPNDCAELRWGAAEGSAEAATCRRRAPAAQRARMQEYRGWFAARRRPPR